MSAFTSSGAVYPFLAADTGRWAWVLAEPLSWEVRGVGQGFTITVPQGFLTDLGTVPWWARLILNPADPQLAKPFILHDGILAAYGPKCQPFAASQLYEAARAVGVPEWRRKAITVAVVVAIDDW